MTSKLFLISQLESTARTIEWALRLMPEERFYQQPPAGLDFGAWSAARLLFHLLHYEEAYTIPALQHWLGGPQPIGDLFAPAEDWEALSWQAVYRNRTSLDELLSRFYTARAQQIDLIDRIPTEAWPVKKVATGHGPVTPDYVVAKTIQHTVEQSNSLLKNALYWEQAGLSPAIRSQAPRTLSSASSAASKRSPTAGSAATPPGPNSRSAGKCPP